MVCNRIEYDFGDYDIYEVDILEFIVLSEFETKRRILKGIAVVFIVHGKRPDVWVWFEMWICGFVVWCLRFKFITRNKYRKWNISTTNLLMAFSLVWFRGHNCKIQLLGGISINLKRLCYMWIYDVGLIHRSNQSMI